VKRRTTLSFGQAREYASKAEKNRLVEFPGLVSSVAVRCAQQGASGLADVVREAGDHQPEMGTSPIRENQGLEQLREKFGEKNLRIR